MPAPIILTGSRGRLAAILHTALAPAGFRLQNFSRSGGDGHFPLADLFTSGALERAGAVVHLAWSTVPFTSERNVGWEWQVDLPLLARLLNALTAPAAGTPSPHLIFFSSGGTVYGNAPQRPSREEDTLAPIGWHGVGKIAAESLIAEYGRRKGLRYTIFRLSNPYGFAASGHQPQGVIPLLIDANLRGVEFNLWGDGLARKDYLFHTDLVAAVELALERRPQGVYNLAAGASHSLREIIAQIETTMGRRLRLNFLPPYPWDVASSELDNSRLRTELGWAPKVDFADGLATTIRSLIGG